MNMISKQAASQQQGGGSQEFEQAFFKLAYDKLQAKLFNLLPFLVGFELVKKNDGNSKAVGVFGFKSNNGQILFVPAFFINGKVKDMDIMYSRNNNQFYPLNEDFAGLFLKDDVTGLGSPAKQTKEEIEKDTRRLNMRETMYPPRHGRVTYASMKDDTEFCLTMNKVAAELVATPYDPEIKSASLTDFLQECGPGVRAGFWQLLEKDAAFAEATSHFYSHEELIGALMTKESAVKLKETPKLRVVRFGEKMDTSKMDGNAVKTLASRGFLIEDNRTSDEVSKVGLFKYNETFSNPVDSGFYPYITELGTLRFGVVLMRPRQLYANFASDKAIVLDLEAEQAGQAYLVSASEVFVKDAVTLKDFSSVHAMLEEPAEALPGYDDYILLNDQLTATQPFRLVENYKDSAGIRRLKVQPTFPGEFGPGELKNAKNKPVILVLTKREGNSLEYRNSAVYVPKNFKLLKLHTSECYSEEYDATATPANRKTQATREDKERTRIRQGQPGGLHHLDGYLRERNVFPLTVQTNGSEYFVSVAGVKAKYTDALCCKIGMVVDLGLAESQSEEVMAKLAGSRSVEGHIKIAYLGDQPLALEDEQPYTNELGQPTYSGVPFVDSADISDGYAGDPTQLGLGVKPDIENIQQNVQSATSLAQAGQKEIFDTQAIATLARYSNPNDKIMSYVPSFITSLDKLGRMLFMVYWETDKFQQLYGKDEMPELVELVKNVFNNLGDLIIFMKRRTPDLSINNNEQSEDQI